jgi:hypothetical protein
MSNDPFSSSNRAKQTPSLAEREKQDKQEHEARRDAVTKRDKEARERLTKQSTQKPYVPFVPR